MKRLTIFASGSGSNAENMINYFKGHKNIEVVQVLTNNKNAKVIDRCKRLHVKCLVFNKEMFFKENDVINLLKETTDYIILAGFLWKIPQNILTLFPKKIINIHPALLPKYGGKGMYGNHIHKKVLENKEAKTGITIHYVNENYDEGAIIFQKEVVLDKNETLQSLQNKIHHLEMENFPKIVENTIIND